MAQARGEEERVLDGTKEPHRQPLDDPQARHRGTQLALSASPRRGHGRPFFKVMTTVLARYRGKKFLGFSRGL
ncbi:hypothetical protein GCM10009660_15430 [Catellatospora bangladeshensis]